MTGVGSVSTASQLPSVKLTWIQYDNSCMQCIWTTFRVLCTVLYCIRGPQTHVCYC